MMSKAIPGKAGTGFPSAIAKREQAGADDHSRRSTQTVVRFSSAFLLPGFDEPQPAGDYRVDHDEESIEGASWLAWHRTGSFIHLPGIGMQAPTHQMVPINPAALEAALKKDNAQS
jgi:hypothetical protein